MLTVLGLGPGDASLLTREAWEVLSQAQIVYLRTRKHPTVKGLPSHLKLRSFDRVYDSGEDFAQVYAAIIKKVVALARKGDVIYAVPGHPLVGESTVPQILAQARADGIETRIVSGLSFIEPVLETAAANGEMLDAMNGLQIADGIEIAAMHHPPLNPDAPALVAQVYSRAVASDVKLTLMNQYPPTHPVLVMDGAKGKARRVPIHQMDHADTFDHLTSLIVPALPAPASFEALQETMAYLRAPEGCPWDQEQTHESLRNTLLEETCEVLDAIDVGDMQALQEELGDLLFNVLFQVQMATEAEEFRMTDVIGEIDAKLKRRHPHVFGELKVKDTGEVLRNWDAIKKNEEKTHGKPKRESALDGVPRSLPALARTQKLASRAERGGFKWGNLQQRLDKVHEELNEVLTAPDAQNRAEEVGDLLFMVADLAMAWDVDAESALREANNKFVRRFHAMERIARERDWKMKEMDDVALLNLWKEAKKIKS